MSHRRSGSRSREECYQRRVANTAVFIHSMAVLGNFRKFANDLMALIPDQDAVDQLITAYEPQWRAVEHGLDALGCMAVEDIADHERLCETGRDDRKPFTLRRLLMGEVGDSTPFPTTNATVSAEESLALHPDSEVPA